MQSTHFTERTRQFWDWFAAHEERLSELLTQLRRGEETGESILDAFSEGTSLLHPDLKFHVGGDHDVVFAVGGNHPLFYLLPYVTKNLPARYREKWHFFPCMPGGGTDKAQTFVMHGASVSANQVMLSVTKRDNVADLRFYAREWEPLDNSDCLSAFFTLMDICLGEALSHLCVGTVERGDRPEDGAIPLTELAQWLLDNVCADGQIPDPADRYTAYEGTPPENPPLRLDIQMGVTACLPLVKEYGSDEASAYQTFIDYGAKPVFLHYFFDGQEDRKAMLDQRYAITDTIEERVLGARGSGQEIGLVLGGAMGDHHAYIELLLYDEAAFFEKIPPVLAAFPHMVFFHDFHPFGRALPLSDETVAAFVDRLEKTLAKDEEEGADLVHAAAAEIVSVIETLDENQRDYATTNIYSRCLNNTGAYQQALDVLDAVREQGESDYRWHYKRAFALYFIDGREAEAEAELMIAKGLAKPGESLSAVDELLEDINDWKKRVRQSKAPLTRFKRFLKRLFHKNEKARPVTYYTQEEMETIESFIGEHFGKFENIFHEIVSEDIHVDLCIIPPAPERNHYTIVTMGMGAVAMNVPEGIRDHRVSRSEVLLTLPPDWDLHNEDEKHYWPLRLLKVLARLPIQNQTWLGWGHTISNQSSFAENTKLSSAILLMPGHFGQQALTCPLPGGDEVAFYQAIPLYESEMSYKLEQGTVALLNCFPQRYDMIVDPHRPNYVE